MEMRQRIFGSVMVCIVVCIDCLSLETRYGIELLDCGSAQTCQSTKNSTLDFSHLRVLHCVNESILGLCCMVLQLLCSVFFPKGRNLVEVHLKVVCHFFRQLIFRSLAS